MREILFRGKSILNKKWVEGYYYKTKFYTSEARLFDFITIPHPEIKDRRSDHEMIIPETLGQYTGLIDKNGTKIFEGDILRLWDKNAGYEWFAVVEFGNPNWYSNWGWQLRGVKGHYGVNKEILLWIEMEESGAFSEVIGNIHDNSELLER